jgi:glycosyltransferase involved in cell wall biosynthesis
MRFKNVTVNGRFLCRQMTGVDRFATEVLLAVDQLLGTPEFKHVRMRIWVPEPPIQQPAFKHIQIKRLPIGRGQLWEQLVLPLATAGSTLVNLCNTGPVLKRKQYTVIHDATTVSMPEAFSKSFRLWYRFLMPALGVMSRKVLTVSEYAKSDIARCFGIAPGHMVVLGEGGDHIHRHASDTSILAKHGLQANQYFLAVSSNAPHKNFKLIGQALALGQVGGMKVAIAGGNNQRVFGTSGPAAHADIAWLGYVSDAELKALYENAAAFVFPSLHEGFGLPLVEAMELGCPVLSSNTASMPEVCGDAALYFSPTDAAQLLTQMQAMAANPGLRAQYAAKGLERAKHWKWHKAARNLLAEVLR